MKFLKAITPTISKEVRIKTPDGEQLIGLVWKRPNDDERINLLGEINASAERIGEMPTAAEQTEAIKAHIKQSRERIKCYLLDWDFKDEGMAVEFTSANLDAALEWNEYRAPIDASLVNALTLSSEDAKAGNSSRLDSTLPAPTTPEK